jgi:hypothetical protein
MTLDEIKADVEHCKAVWCETGDPCYHCGQKLWLIQELEKYMNPPVTLIVTGPTPEQVKQQFRDSINQITNTWKMPIFNEPLTPVVNTDTKEVDHAERSLTTGPEGDQQLAGPGQGGPSEGPPIGSGG